VHHLLFSFISISSIFIDKHRIVIIAFIPYTTHGSPLKPRADLSQARAQDLSESSNTTINKEIEMRTARQGPVKAEKNGWVNSKTNKDARVGTISARHSIRALARSQLPDYLAGLNPKQLQAVRYGIKTGDAKHVGPLLIIAGAGTGKTTTIAARAAHLIVNGNKPDRISLLTFTRRAAA
jgi:chromosomal replication initiation ATPase DnaA